MHACIRTMHTFMRSYGLRSLAACLKTQVYQFPTLTNSIRVSLTVFSHLGVSGLSVNLA